MQEKQHTDNKEKQKAFHYVKMGNEESEKKKNKTKEKDILDHACILEALALALQVIYPHYQKKKNHYISQKRIKRIRAGG